MDPTTRALMSSMFIMGIGSALTFLATWFWHQRNLAIKEAEKIAIAHSTLVSRVADLEKQLGSVSTSIAPISAAFQAILIKELTHFHTPRMDELMTRVGPPSELTETEEEELGILLKERSLNMADEIPESERNAAELLPLVLKRVRSDFEIMKDTAAIQMVKVPLDDSDGGVHE